MNPRDELLDRLIAEGKSDAEIRAALKQFDSANMSQGGGKPVSGFEMVKALAQDAIPVLGTFLDEAEGASKGVGAYLADKVKGRKTTLKGRIQEEMQLADDEVRNARKAMGVPGAVLGTALGIGTGSAALKYGSKAARLLAGVVNGPTGGKLNAVTRAGKSVALGAGLGATTGYGAGKPGERGGSATIGGVLGAAAGAAGPLVEGAGAAKRWVGEKMRSYDPTVRATQAIMHPVQVDQIEGAIGGAPRFAGETVADVAANAPSNHTDALMREAVGAPTFASGDMKRAMATRAEGRLGRVQQEMAQGTRLSQPINPRQLMDDLRASRTPAVSAAYKTAEAEGEILDDAQLRKALGDTPLAREARRVALLRMKNRRINLPVVQREVPVDVPWHDGGTVSMTGKGPPVAVPNFTLGDYAKRHLDTKIKGLLKQSDLGKAAEAVEIRDRLVQRMDELVPSYAAARLASREQQALKEAVRLGQALGKTPSTDVRDATNLLDRLVPQQSDPAIQAQIREAFRQGVASSLQARLAKAKNGVQAITQLVGHDNAEEVARLAFPDDASFQTFSNALMHELRQLPGEAGVKGSHVDAALFRDNALGPATPWALSQALKGSPQLLASQAVGESTRGISHQVNKDTAEEITRAMQARVGSPDAQKILARIKQERDVIPQRLRTQAAQSRVSGRKATTRAQRLLQSLLARENDE